MSNSVFHSVMLQLKDISDRTFGVIDSDGCVISSTDALQLGERWLDAALRVASVPEGMTTFGQRTFKPILSGTGFFEYAVFCSGDDETARTLCSMAYIALNDAKVFYEEKHDRGTFVKNIIMDNILPGDIYIRAKELHFATDAPRAVFLVRQVGHADVATVDVLSSLFPDRGQDFVLSINESDVAVIKQLSGNVEAEELERIAKNIEDTLKNELFIKSVIGILTDFYEILFLSKRNVSPINNTGLVVTNKNSQSLKDNASTPNISPKTLVIMICPISITNIIETNPVL